MNPKEHQILSDLMRRLENLIIIGTIDTLDHPGRRLRVQSGDMLTDWLPWPAAIGRHHRRWHPLREGQQVILACPSGDPAQAVIIGQLYSNPLPPPSTADDLDIIEWDDGSYISYNSTTHRRTMNIVGDAIINVQGNVDAAVGGDVDLIAGGTIRHDADSIHHNGGDGVVTGECICHFTGRPHGDKSSTVTAGK